MKSLLLQTYKPGRERVIHAGRVQRMQQLEGHRQMARTSPRKGLSKEPQNLQLTLTIRRGVGVIASKNNSQEQCKFNLELVNHYLIYSYVKGVELGLLIGQTVYINNLWLSLCLLKTSNHRLLSVSCLKNLGTDSLTMSIVMSYTDWGHLNILGRCYKCSWRV